MMPDRLSLQDQAGAAVYVYFSGGESWQEADCHTEVLFVSRVV